MKKPKLGQVFLIDYNIIQKIVTVSEVNATDHVIEIGCGDGILTKALCHVLDRLIVIEIDNDCILNTKKNLNQQNVIQWIHEDVLKVNFAEFNAPLKIIANIPYYLSAKLIQKIAGVKTLFKDITIMIQKEFAYKCYAGPGEKAYTSLSVFTQRHFTVEKCFDVSRNCFRPIPNVDSTVIKLKPKLDNLEVSDLFFDQVVNACFWGKRKKLSTALNQNPYVKFSMDVRQLIELEFLLSKRADQLSLKQYKELASKLQRIVV